MHSNNIRGREHGREIRTMTSANETINQYRIYSVETGRLLGVSEGRSAIVAIRAFVKANPAPSEGLEDEALRAEGMFTEI